MEYLINPRVKDIQFSGIRQFFNMVSDYEDVISLTIGQPDFSSPEGVKEAGKWAIDHDYTTYTHNAGLLPLRQAACNFVKNKYGLEYDHEEEVIVTSGASEAIDIALRTIVEEGTEVILPGPAYPSYEALIRLSGGIPVFVDTRNSGFKLTASLIKEHLTDKTRCLILPYPSNPTGCTLNFEDLKEIAELLKDKDIFVLSDEVYSELVFKGSHYSIASFPGMKEKTVVVNGLSKSHSMTGWRIGFAFAPAFLTKYMVKVHQFSIACASSISQYAAIEALTKGMNSALTMKHEYMKRMHYSYKRLKFLGFDVEEPNGTFYIFPSIKRFNMTSLDFATKLLQEAGVAVVPGSAFSEYGEGFVRLSYAYSMETLEEAFNRIEQFVNRM
ncbi:aminotransferase A [Calidifontibacillus erzurumensis]|uniref:Aminotransferase n=1 Tax=Calidifontibacillus erzurumensis TaxID=2741433 RepID=A0A8J8GB48_9BACI|nr:aminotransferase A [Calidifontibacillus erzurumensis]NSL50655.1 aminotransferase A [Calidifontibacillus erzurumensis]